MDPKEIGRQEPGVSLEANPSTIPKKAGPAKTVALALLQRARAVSQMTAANAANAATTPGAATTSSAVPASMSPSHHDVKYDSTINKLGGTNMTPTTTKRLVGPVMNMTTAPMQTTVLTSASTPSATAPTSSGDYKNKQIGRYNMTPTTTKWSVSPAMTLATDLMPSVTLALTTAMNTASLDTSGLL